MENKKELVLTINELLFLASEAGATEFFGVGDPFFYMSVEQIRSTFENAAASLDKKGYGEMDFEGKFQMSEEVSSLIQPCAFCRAYLTVENGRNKERIVYYLTEDVLVKLWRCEDGWHLKSAESEEETETLCNKFSYDRYNMKTPQIKISAKYLKQLKNAVLYKNEEEQKQILEQLENEEMKIILMDIVSEKTETSSLIRSDFDSESVYAILYLNTEHGAILVTESEDKQTDDWYLEPASHEQIKGEIERMLVGISA